MAGASTKYRLNEKVSYLHNNQLKSLNYDTVKQLAWLREQKEKQVKNRLSLRDKNNSYSDEVSIEQDSPQKKEKNQDSVDNLQNWKRLNGFDQNIHVYIVKGGYHELREALDARGWVENPDPYSNCFDLKWTTQMKDVPYDNLLNYQVVNHFKNNESCTSKYGLAKNLKFLIYGEGIEVDKFYPRCFDLSDLSQFEDWIEDYKFTRNEAILKNFLSNWDDNSQISDNQNLRIRLASNCCMRRFLDIYNEIYCIHNEVIPLINPEEWEVIWRDDYDFKKENPKRFSDLLNKLQNVKPKFNQSWNDQETVESLNQQLKKIALDALNTAKSQDPQFKMNGNNNIWIIKPVYMSRGRGIRLFDQFGKIMDHIIGNDVQYVAQKYIENPMLINKKKFDIRLWVLVQDFCPPKIWVYNECYIRMCASEYTTDNIDNRFIHLTNNCVQKFNQNKNKTEIMWTQEQLADLLFEKTGRNIFYEEIQPKMWEIIVWSLRCVSDSVGARKNSMEVFGYDFMIDTDYQPWLIEINSSPSMDYSTKITSRLCKAVMQDTIRVIIDYTWAKKGTKKQVNTGGFILIDKGKVYPVVHYNANKKKE